MKNNKNKIFLMSLPLLTLISSSEINAEIFKWTDERGVVQFSATPPVQNFSPMTANDKVNALQKQELCVVGPIKKVSPNTVVVPTDSKVANTNSAVTTTNKVATPVATTVAKKATTPAPVITTSFFNSFTTNLTTYIAQTKARIALLAANIRKALAILTRNDPKPPVVTPPVVVAPPVIPPIVVPPVVVPPVITPPVVVVPPPVVPVIVPPVVTPPEIVWTKCSDENQICRFTGTKRVRFGVEGKYVTKVFKDDILCTPSVFTDPAFGIFKACDVSNEITTETPVVETWENPVVQPPVITPPVIPPVIVPPVVVPPPVVTPPVVVVPPVVIPPVVTPPPPVTVPTSFLPIVDISQNITPAIGFNTIRIHNTTEIAPPSGGEFRISCPTSHMSNDDPIIYPNQQGAAHHHTFFGNTSINYKSDLSNLANVGNSTCSGGIMNRSAYWVPSMINTVTNKPMHPNGGQLTYYKSGAIDGTLIKAPPKGLRIIAGNSKGTANTDWDHAGFKCHPGPNSKRTDWPNMRVIPTGALCEVGDDLMMSVGFPQCWDGKNLDSPDHKSHMSYVSHRTNQLPNYYCPASHPIPIPEITLNVHWTIQPGDDLTKWRLASDNYQFNGTNAGYSVHGDYVEGWDRPLLEGIIKNCLNGKRDAHAHLLCDGRAF